MKGKTLTEASATTLYRFYDADGRLLYVGITEQGAMRWRAHRKDKDWWTDVVTTTTEHFATRAEAAAAEVAAIKSEGPLYNVAHNGPGNDSPEFIKNTIDGYNRLKDAFPDAVIVDDQKQGARLAREALEASRARKKVPGPPPARPRLPAPMESAARVLVNGIQVGDVVAVRTTVDDYPPVGLVVEANDVAIRLRRYSFLSCEFSLPEQLIMWQHIVSVLFADLETDPEWQEPGRKVYDMGPLGNFQTRWTTQEYRGRVEAS